MPITSIPLITHKNYTNKAMPSILALIIFKPLSTAQLPVRPPSSLAPCVGCSVLLGTPRLKSPTSGVNPNPWFPALLPHSAETTAHMCDKRASVPPSLLFHCSQLTSDLAAYTSWLNPQPTRVSLKCSSFSNSTGRALRYLTHTTVQLLSFVVPRWVYVCSEITTPAQFPPFAAHSHSSTLDTTAHNPLHGGSSHGFHWLNALRHCSWSSSIPASALRTHVNSVITKSKSMVGFVSEARLNMTLAPARGLLPIRWSSPHISLLRRSSCLSS
jgi:hypothetical protein